MLSITVKSTGSFANLERFLLKMSKNDLFSDLDTLAQEGVAALRANTPIDSGFTADSWYYEINIDTNGTSSIEWKNSNIQNGEPIAILLQYGHGTGTGGYVEGRDYINPAIKPIFDKISQQVWKKVTSA